VRLFLLTHRGARLLHCAFLPLLLVGCAASVYPSKPGVHQRYDRTRLEPLQHRPQRMPLGAPAAGVAAIDGAQRVDMTGRAGTPAGGNRFLLPLAHGKVLAILSGTGNPGLRIAPAATACTIPRSFATTCGDRSTPTCACVPGSR
jgi:hypothetical protein